MTTHASTTRTSITHASRSGLPTILLDCDPGIDDAYALFYLSALHHAREINLVGVTTTAGNTTVENTARNAAWVLGHCSPTAPRGAPAGTTSMHAAAISPVPVAMGHPTPLELELETTPETHGLTGLGYATSTWPGTMGSDAPGHGVRLGSQWREVWEHALRTHDDVHLVVTGPATNAAIFAQEHPELFARFSAITVMGGAINYPGNTTPTAEWNFWVDPHAAQKLFEVAPVPVTLCSLGVTEQMLLTPARLRELQNQMPGTTWSGLLEEITRFYFEFHDGVGEGYQAQIHDLLTVMIAVGAVDTISTKTRVAVEAESELFRGTSVADFKNHWGREPNARVIREADISAAFAELNRAARLAAGYLR
ncbi:nucleoside hydrolase [Corynebacterium pseudodiphtheriticum]|uniref:nucleoside hydrolase n=1 Tax=Corynebacterium pseudodiphtheriticum TaxID=37637 RepID=UPI00254B33B0|nr:nucleoside hydrolase [Corynebacterium pseudodiphtheriticum]MDK8576854.1 nucleoside hydrolase [Corynebacterium pseudodiphtheriticum]